MRFFCLFVLCSAFALPAVAQEEFEIVVKDSLPINNQTRPKPLRFLELGISANAYKGDLSVYEKWTACYHAGIRFNEAKRLNGRAGIGVGFITADNRTYKTTEGKPNNFFRTQVFHLSYEAHYNFVKTPAFMCYASLGLGLCNYQPFDDKGEKLANQLDTRALDEAYGRTAFMLPVGLGVSYLLKNGYGISLHASWLNTQSDYLDNISLWGKKSGKDNVLSVRFSILAPLLFKKSLVSKPVPRNKKYYTREFE